MKGKLITNATCPQGRLMKEAVTEALSKGESVPVKIILGGSKKLGRFPVYVDKESDRNIFAQIVSIENEGALLSDSEISEIAEQEYTVAIKAVDGNEFEVEIDLKESPVKTLKNDGHIPSELAEMMSRKVDDGVITAEEAERKVLFMMENYVDLPLMKRVVKQWRTYNRTSHCPKCLYADPYLESARKKKEEGKIARGLRYAVGHRAVIEEGEKSVGKNVFVETLAWLLNKPYYLITFSRQMSPSSVYGEKSTDNSAAEYFKTEAARMAAEGRQSLEDVEAAISQTRRYYETMCEKANNTTFTERDYSALVNEAVASGDFSALLLGGGKIEIARRNGSREHEEMKNALDALIAKKEELKKSVAELELKSAQAQSVNIIIDQSELYDWLIDGGLMVFNEMNMAEANFFASFTNQLLDGTGFIFMPGRGDVKVNPDCVLCGTQNADYEGVEQQNEATMSRFNCMVFEQPESIKKQLKVAVESELRKDGFDDLKPENEMFNLVEKFYKVCRSSVARNDISNAVLNIRGFVRAVTDVTESEGYLSLRNAVFDAVINTCPVDERQALYQMATSIFEM